MSRPSPEAIVIGGSAGAFEALSAILPELAADYPLPILIVVHLPSDRRSLFAELFRALGAPARDGRDGADAAFCLRGKPHVCHAISAHALARSQPRPA